MKRRIFVLVIIFAALLSLMFTVNAEQEITENGEIIDERLITDELNDFFTEQEFSIEELKEMTFPEVLQRIWQQVKQTAVKPIKLFARLCAVLILSTILRQFGQNNTNKGIENSIDTAVTVAVFVLVSMPLLELLANIETMLVTVKDTLICFIPVFSSVMVSCGQPAAAVIYSGMFLSVITFVVYLLVQYILPFLRIYMALNITGGISGSLKLGGITSVIAKVIKWVLGLLATVFAAMLSFQTFVAQGADSIAMRTGKFLLGSGVPVIGRAVSDAMGTVIAGLKVVKGMVGVMGVIGLIGIFLPVLISCIAYYLSVLLASGVAGALDNNKGMNVLKGFAECLTIYIAIILFFAMLVIFATVIMIMTGNGGGT